MPDTKTKPSASEVLERLDAITAAIATLASMDRDRFLSKLAESHGAEKAIATAASLGLDSRSWQNERQDRQRWLTQHSTTTLRYGNAFDADEDEEVIRLMQQSPMASMDMINLARQAAIARHEAAGGSRQIGPGAYPADKPQAPVQVSRRSTNPEAQFNADAGTATPVQPAKSSPPFSAADPSRS